MHHCLKNCEPGDIIISSSYRCIVISRSDYLVYVEVPGVGSWSFHSSDVKDGTILKIIKKRK